MATIGQQRLFLPVTSFRPRMACTTPTGDCCWGSTCSQGVALKMESMLYDQNHTRTWSFPCFPMVSSYSGPVVCRSDACWGTTCSPDACGEERRARSADSSYKKWLMHCNNDTNNGCVVCCFLSATLLGEEWDKGVMHHPARYRSVTMWGNWG